MRCATCGTENAPDSRFCGGCGARMPDAPRLVPATQKIDDNATFPAGHPSAAPGVHGPNTYQSGPAQMPPQSVPPQNNYASELPGGVPSGYAIAPPASIPPQNNPYQPVKSAPPQASAPYQPVKSTPPQASVPPVNNGRSIPPTNDGRSIPPANQAFAPSAPARSPHPAGSIAESLSKPPGRRWGLIIFVLLVDLALAGAGAFLLREGLS